MQNQSDVEHYAHLLEVPELEVSFVPGYQSALEAPEESVAVSCNPTQAGLLPPCEISH